jgi:curved DNA-binding protein CbpA
LKWRELSQGGGEGYLKKVSDLPPHEILGISPTADSKELVRAYRMLAAKYHPDRLDDFLKPYSGRMMAIINRAYEMERARRGL